MKKREPIILLFTLLSFLYSCSKIDKKSTPCNDTRIGTLRFSPEDFKVVPYTHAQTLIFKSDEGDSVLYNYLKKDSTFFSLSQYGYYRVGCLENYFTIEKRLTLFNNPDSGKIIINMSFSDPFEDRVVSKFLYFSIYFSDGFPNNDYLCGFKGLYVFTSDSIKTYKKDTVYNGFVKTFHQHVVLGQVQYDSVYELQGSKQSLYYIPCTEYLATLFYTFKLGIIGFQLNTGKTWYLKP